MRTRSQAKAAAFRSETSRARRESREGSPTNGTGASGSPARGMREEVGIDPVADPRRRLQTEERASISTARPVPVPPPLLLSLARGLSTPYGSRRASRTNKISPARVPRTTVTARHAPPIVVSSPDDTPVPAPALSPPPTRQHCGRLSLCPALQVESV